MCKSLFCFQSDSHFENFFATDGLARKECVSEPHIKGKFLIGCEAVKKSVSFREHENETHSQ